jgi:gp16 family phage-associated protein
MPAAAVASQQNYGVDPARREKVRHEFRSSGKSLRSWASENGFNPKIVQAVLNGNRRALRGQSHDIAVALGLKDGEIAND